MRSRLRGAGAGQSAVKGTRGGGAAAGPRGAFPHHGQAPAGSSQPLGSRWVQVGCAFGGGALRRASCGQHPVSVGMGGPQARGGKAGQHLQLPHTCRALLLRRRSQGLRGILAPQATSEDTARSGDRPGMTGVHGPITGASQPQRSRGTAGLCAPRPPGDLGLHTAPTRPSAPWNHHCPSLPGPSPKPTPLCTQGRDAAGPQGGTRPRA